MENKLMKMWAKDLTTPPHQRGKWMENKHRKSSFSSCWGKPQLKMTR